MAKKSPPLPSEPPAPEFSRPVDVTTLPASGLQREIAATPAECEALARRFDLPGIGALTARLAIGPIRSGGAAGARVIGHFSARVSQICVLSLEPFESEISEPIELDLLPPESIPDGADADSHLNQSVEPLEGHVFDLGELVAQHLSLALDPYPRRSGVSFASEPGITGESDALARPKPFAALGDLKRKM